MRGVVRYDTIGGDGDFDGDGDVDGHDFLAWQRGESPNPLSSSDLDDWKANFGSGVQGVGQIEASAVPEPSTTAIALIAMLGSSMFVRRER
jgi:hypothetical protein